MIKFKQYLKEVELYEASEANEFSKQLVTIGKKYFPKSLVKAQHSLGLGSSIDFLFALGTKKDWANGILHNDPAHHRWMIGFDQITRDGKIMGKMEAELSIGNSIFKAYNPNQMGTKREKIGWRKKTGEIPVLLKHFENYFKKLRAAVDKAKPDLDPQYQDK